MLIQEPSVYLAYQPLAPQLEQCTREQATTGSQTYRKVIHTEGRPLNNFVFRHTADEVADLDQSGRRVVWVRLTDLVREPFGSLFRAARHSGYDERLVSRSQCPSFFTQIGLLPWEYYQSIFTSLSFNAAGRYKLIAQLNGSYSITAIDDWVPAYQSTNTPLWGMDAQCPWAILLLKAWATVNGGYQTLANCQPFQFIRTFTFPNWKLRILNSEAPSELLSDLRRMLPNNIGSQETALPESKLQSIVHEPLGRPGEDNGTLLQPSNLQVVARGDTEAESHQQPHQQPASTVINSAHEMVNSMGSAMPIQQIPASQILMPPGVYVPPPPRPLLSQQPNVLPNRPIPQSVRGLEQPQIAPNQSAPALQPVYPHQVPAWPQRRPLLPLTPPQQGLVQTTTTIANPLLFRSILGSVTGSTEPPQFMSFMPTAFTQVPSSYPVVFQQYQTLRPPVASYSVPPPTIQHPSIQPPYAPNLYQPLYRTPAFPHPAPQFSFPSDAQVITGAETIHQQANPLLTRGFGSTIKSSHYGSQELNYTVVAKTKDNAKLYEYGLAPNAAGYRIMQLLRGLDGQILLKIETATNNDWNGKYSFYDPKLNSLPAAKSISLNLRRSFLIPYEDFYNLFSHVIVSSIDYSNLVGVKHEFLSMSVSPNLQQARHFYLKVENPCVLDLSIVQTGECIKQQVAGSLLQKRFLKAKVMISRQRSVEGRVMTIADILRRSRVDNLLLRNPTSNLHQSRLRSKFGIEAEGNQVQSSVSIHIDGSNLQAINVWQPVEEAPAISPQQVQSTISNTFNRLPSSQNEYEYMLLKQTNGLCQNETFQGLFSKGEYILRVKMEPHASLYEYTLHITSSLPVELRPISLTKEEKSFVLRSTVMDYCRRIITKKQYLTQDRRSGHCDWVCFRPSYEELGYGFVAFLSEELSSNRILCRFNPAYTESYCRVLRQQGFLCKDIYKNRNEDIELESSRGVGHVVLLKSIHRSVGIPSSFRVFLDRSLA